MKEALSFLPQQDAALRAGTRPDEIILQEGDKIMLKRAFWGHRPGTIGRVAVLHKPSPVNHYIGKLKLPGSDFAGFTLDDIPSLFTKI